MLFGCRFTQGTYFLQDQTPFLSIFAMIGVPIWLDPLAHFRHSDADSSIQTFSTGGKKKVFVERSLSRVVAALVTSVILKTAVYIRRKGHTASARLCVGWSLMLIQQCVELPWRLPPLLFGVAGNVWGFGDTIWLFTLISLAFNWPISLIVSLHCTHTGKLRIYS